VKSTHPSQTSESISQAPQNLKDPQNSPTELSAVSSPEFSEAILKKPASLPQSIFRNSEKNAPMQFLIEVRNQRKRIHISKSPNS
jgi:hypothetical protein